MPFLTLGDLARPYLLGVVGVLGSPSEATDAKVRHAPLPAAPCGTSPSQAPATTLPVVTVSFDAGLLEPDTQSEVLGLLHGQLTPRRIAVCAADREKAATPQGRAVATIRLLAGSRADELTIAIEDHTTDKQTLRSVDLTRTPKDARALTLAIAIDELMRASWAELALASTPSVEGTARRGQAPLAVRETATTTVRGRHAGRFSLGAAYASEHYTGGQHHLGADLRLVVHAIPRLAFGLRLGGRRGLFVPSEHGRIATSAVVVGVSAAVRVTPTRARVGLYLPARVDVVPLFAAGRPSPDAVGGSGRGTVVTVSGGASLVTRLGAHMLFFVEASLGGTLRAVHVTDAGRTASSASGLVGALALGFAGGP